MNLRTLLFGISAVVCAAFGFSELGGGSQQGFQLATGALFALTVVSPFLGGIRRA
jgi:uncharacterized membrane protein YdfJ with MMPL/SSD domain